MYPVLGTKNPEPFDIPGSAVTESEANTDVHPMRSRK
jgi:hypothetical protein